jgi:hypothetical protein
VSFTGVVYGSTLFVLCLSCTSSLFFALTAFFFSLPDGFEAESPLEAMLARVARPSVNQPKAAWAPESRQEWTQNEAPQRETRVR